MPFFEFEWHLISSCLTQVIPIFRISGLCPTDVTGNFPSLLNKSLLKNILIPINKPDIAIKTTASINTFIIFNNFKKDCLKLKFVKTVFLIFKLQFF